MPAYTAHTLFSTDPGPVRSFMVFTFTNPSTGTGVLVNYGIDPSGKDLEMPGPFNIWITTDSLRGMRFHSGGVYPVETLRRVWTELVTGDWKPYTDHDTLVNHYAARSVVRLNTPG